MAFSSQVIRITPKMAQEYLDTDEENRNIRQGHLNGLVADMASGRWVFDGAPIRFDVDGKLLDGQHRMLAIVRSGKAQKMVVQTGLPRESRRTMDKNARRSVADNLRMDCGIVNSFKVSAIARVVLRWREGNIRNATMQPTDNEVYDFVLDNNLTLQDAANFSSPVARELGGSPQAVGAAYHETMLVAAEDAVPFWGKVHSGVELKPGEAALILRSALLRLDKIAKIGSRPTLTLELCIRAWNLMRQGKTQDVLLVKPLDTIPDSNFELR